VRGRAQKNEKKRKKKRNIKPLRLFFGSTWASHGKEEVCGLTEPPANQSKGVEKCE
jgi:hypothetical protein